MMCYNTRVLIIPRLLPQCHLQLQDHVIAELVRVLHLEECMLEGQQQACTTQQQACTTQY